VAGWEIPFFFWKLLAGLVGGLEHEWMMTFHILGK